MIASHEPTPRHRAAGAASPWSASSNLACRKAKKKAKKNIGQLLSVGQLTRCFTQRFRGGRPEETDFWRGPPLAPVRGPSKCSTTPNAATNWLTDIVVSREEPIGTRVRSRLTNPRARLKPRGKPLKKPSRNRVSSVHTDCHSGTEYENERRRDARRFGVYQFPKVGCRPKRV